MWSKVASSRLQNGEGNVDVNKNNKRREDSVKKNIFRGWTFDVSIITIIIIDRKEELYMTQIDALKTDEIQNYEIEHQEEVRRLAGECIVIWK